MARIYIYVVDRDFGFAPNPFHGCCTLATCKPDIRSTAGPSDWIFGVGGGRLRATGKCVFAMRVTEKMTFNSYHLAPRFADKKPVRNGSRKMMVGDNIYFRSETTSEWSQAHSHHSNADGSLNEYNLKRDTKTDAVLISDHFVYFGSSAAVIPADILETIGYKNGIGHRVFDYEAARALTDWLEQEYANDMNKVLGEPFDFARGDAHYSVLTNKISNYI